MLSKLDLLVIGPSNIVTRVQNAEQGIRVAPPPGVAVYTAPPVIQQPTTTPVAAGGITEYRPNLLANAGFELTQRGTTVPDGWGATNATFINQSGCEGSACALLYGNGAIGQTVNLALTGLSNFALIISFYARAVADYEGEVLIRLLRAGNELTGETVYRQFEGAVVATNVVPSNGWYRFWRVFKIGSGSSSDFTVVIRSQSGVQLYVDAVKLELAPSSIDNLSPTPFLPTDNVVNLAVRNLRAENIVTGTLTVGGTSSSAPFIRVLNENGQEFITIGKVSEQFKGIDVKGGNGIVVRSGGDIRIIGGGKLVVGTPTGERTEVLNYGVVGYSSQNNVVFALNEAGAVGQVQVEDGDVLIGNGGTHYAFWDNSLGRLVVRGRIESSLIQTSRFITTDNMVTIDDTFGVAVRIAYSSNFHQGFLLYNTIPDPQNPETGLVGRFSGYTEGSQNFIALRTFNNFGLYLYGDFFRAAGKDVIIGRTETYGGFHTGYFSIVKRVENPQDTYIENYVQDRFGGNWTRFYVGVDKIAYQKIGSEGWLSRFEAKENGDLNLIGTSAKLTLLVDGAAGFTFAPDTSSDTYLFIRNKYNTLIAQLDKTGQFSCQSYVVSGTNSGYILYDRTTPYPVWVMYAKDAAFRLWDSTSASDHFAFYSDRVIFNKPVRASIVGDNWSSVIEGSVSTRIVINGNSGFSGTLVFGPLAVNRGWYWPNVALGAKAVSGQYSIYAVNSGDTAPSIAIYDNYSNPYIYAAWNVGSDLKLKSEVEPIPENKLAAVENVPLKQFRRAATGPPEYGAIAQDLQDSFPELVSVVGPPEGDDSQIEPVLAVNYNSLLVLLLASLRKKAAALLDRVTLAENRLDGISNWRTTVTQTLQQHSQAIQQLQQQYAALEARVRALEQRG